MTELFYRRIFEIAEVCDEASLAAELARIGEEMGFGLYSLLVEKRQFGRLVRSCMMHNAAPEWDSAAMDVETGSRDPFLARMKRFSVPSSYDQSFYVEAGCADLWAQQAAYGYQTGIGTGMHLAGDKHFLIGSRSRAAASQRRGKTRALARRSPVACSTYP